MHLVYLNSKVIIQQKGNTPVDDIVFFPNMDQHLNKSLIIKYKFVGFPFNFTKNECVCIK